MFTLPGKIFKQEVENAENKREELESKLEDLKSKSQTAGEEVRFVIVFRLFTRDHNNLGILYSQLTLT